MPLKSRRIATHGISKSAVAVTTLALLAGCGGGGSGSDEGTSLASYQRGFSVVLTEQYNDDGPADGVEVKNYADLQQLYTDLLSGNASMTIGGPDVFASQAEKGAPIHIAATISPNSTAIVGKQAIREAADVSGKRVAAITSSGGWQLAEARLLEEFGLAAGEDYELINVPDMASGASQVVAGTADYVVGWEPSVNAALASSEDLVVSYSASDADEGETFGTGWQLVLAVRDDVDQATEDEVVEGLQAAAEALQSSPDTADAYGVDFGFTPGTVAGVMDQSVEPFVIEPITPEVQQELEDQLALIGGEEGPLDTPSSFYGGGE